jgi:hypothetical protein
MTEEMRMRNEHAAAYILIGCLIGWLLFVIAEVLYDASVN